jgi:hypothetical protein
MNTRRAESNIFFTKYNKPANLNEEISTLNYGTHHEVLCTCNCACSQP